MLDHFAMMADYNAWANAKLYQAASELDEADLNADRGAFFGSLFGTLSHLLVTDRIWMHRFTGEGPTHKTLTEQPYSTLAELDAARRSEDDRIIAWVQGLTSDDIERVFTYSPISVPGAISQRLAPTLSHVFNHQTHHRGQAHMTLTALGRPSLSLDLIYYLRSDGQRWQ